ncbi:ATP-dependent RNA helicase MAK5 [[Candida] zeylanoides]
MAKTVSEGVRKPGKTPSLKQKLHRESKVVTVDNLKWKAVDVPDTLDDWEGFYGLEEIDGVDVKVEGGVTKFVVKGEGEGESEGEDEDEDEESGEEGERASDAAMESADSDAESEGEFAGFDDKPAPTRAAKEAKTAKTAKAAQEAKEASRESPAGQPAGGARAADPLDHTNFTNLSSIPDVDLPEWAPLNLSSYTLSGLAALGFDSPTDIQRQTIPLAADGRDVIGKASTGSGKTLAYGIPIIERYLAHLPQAEAMRARKEVPAPAGIIFAPTRELAHQVVDHLNKLARHSPLAEHGIVSVTGGLSIQKQTRLLSHGPGVIVATPGRFLELLQKDEALVQRLALTEVVVLDEADRLLQDGHFEEFEKILEMFHKHRGKHAGRAWKWQTLVFSATFAKDLFYKLDKQPKRPDAGAATHSEHAQIVALLHAKLRFKDAAPQFVDANPNDKVSDQISECLVECGPTERDLYLYYFLLMYPGSTLVFANAIDSVKRLVPLLNALGIPTFSIHSSMIQKQRLRAIERFSAATATAKTAVLIASDVAARGLDIPDIDHVAHYHLPRSADVYIHRSGRTGRAGKEGVSVMFCSPQEASGPLRKLRKAISDSKKKSKLKQDVKLLPIEMDLITQLRPRIQLASKLADAEIANTSTRKEDAWVNQAAEDLGIDDLDDIANFDDDILKRMRKRKENKSLDRDDSRAMRYELKQLLSQKLRKNHRRSYITSGLDNLAHQMVSGTMHSEVLGHEKINALDDIRKRPESKVLKPKQSLQQRQQRQKEQKRMKDQQKKDSKKPKQKRDE